MANPLPQIKDANTFGHIRLVGGKREQISVEVRNIERKSPASLDGINMERYLFRTTNAANFCDRFNGTNLVIGVHNGYEGGLISNCPTDIIGSNTPISVHREIGSFETETLQVLACMQDSVMFDGCGNNMVAFLLRSKGHTLDGEIVAFGTTASKG